MFLVNAGAENSIDAEEINEQTSIAENVENDGEQSTSIMDQPVNFSTPEEVEKTLQNIRETEGVVAYKRLKNAMQYITFYDLSLGNSKEKMYQKLDGWTPTTIIAKVDRWGRK